LPEPVQDVVTSYERHLGLERGLSAHTVRAYIGDAVSLLAFLTEKGGDLPGLDIGRLRSWLAAQQSGGASRTTLSPPIRAGGSRRRGRIARCPVSCVRGRRRT